MSKKYGLYGEKYNKLHNGFKLIILKEDYRGWGNGSASKNVSRNELIDIFISVQDAFLGKKEMPKKAETIKMKDKEYIEIMCSWMNFYEHAVMRKYSDIEVKQMEDAALSRIDNRRKITRHLTHIENRFGKANADSQKYSMKEIKCCFAKVVFGCGAIALMSGAVYAYGDNAGMDAVNYLKFAAFVSGAGAILEHFSQKKAAEKYEIASKEVEKVKVMAKNQGVSLPDNKSFSQVMSELLRKDIIGFQKTK